MNEVSPSIADDRARRLARRAYDLMADKERQIPGWRDPLGWARAARVRLAEDHGPKVRQLLSLAEEDEWALWRARKLLQEDYPEDAACIKARELLLDAFFQLRKTH
ncbi:MAG: hypothetical protein M3O70_02385 [Actinomycetota bacterium]|nr:hypothetical protein [Actinomycetota bacterium]